MKGEVVQCLVGRGQDIPVGHKVVITCSLVGRLHRILAMTALSLTLCHYGYCSPVAPSAENNSKIDAENFGKLFFKKIKK